MHLKKLALTCTAAMLLAVTAAWAGNIDFTCSLNPAAACTGTITHSGSNYSTSGINVYNDSGPYNKTVPFSLAFDTSTDNVSIDGTGVYTGQDLLGKITMFTASTCPGCTTIDFSFFAKWPTLPPLVQAFLGTPTGTDSGFAIYLKKSGSPTSVDVTITPTPEPGSLALFGSGLLAIGGALRRKLRRK